MNFKRVLAAWGIGVGAVVGVLLGLQLVSHAQPASVATPSPLAGEEERVEAPAPKRPQQLRIPKLSIATDIEHVALDDEGKMDVPKDTDNVAWYEYGPIPGKPGNAVLAGHLDSETGPAVFYTLPALQVGDKVQVVNDEGEMTLFRVTYKAEYPVDEFPLEEVFGATDASRLNLITCTGSFDAGSRNYSHRTVVYTEVVETGEG